MTFLKEKRCKRCGASQDYAPLEKHHTITRSKGGKETIYLCTMCHRWVHDNPKLAKEKGLYIEDYHIDKSVKL